MRITATRKRLVRAMLWGVTVLVTTFSTVSVASAGSCETATPGDIGVAVNPNASGTKVAGTLSFGYDNLTEDSANNCVRADVVAVLRVQKNSNVLPFSAGLDNVCTNDFLAQNALIQTLVTQKVIPAFFGTAPGAITYDPACPPGTWCVKSLTNILPSQNLGVQNIPIPDTPPRTDISADTKSWSMDVQLAVH